MDGLARTRGAAAKRPVGRQRKTTITLTEQKAFQEETGWGRKRGADDMDQSAGLKGLLETVLRQGQEKDTKMDKLIAAMGDLVQEHKDAQERSASFQQELQGKVASLQRELQERTAGLQEWKASLQQELQDTRRELVALAASQRTLSENPLTEGEASATASQLEAMNKMNKTMQEMTQLLEAHLGIQHAPATPELLSSNGFSQGTQSPPQQTAGVAIQGSTPSSRPSWSSVVQSRGSSASGGEWKTASPKKQATRPKADSKVVRVEIGRARAEKTDFATLRAQFQEGMKEVPALKEAKISCLRLGLRGAVEVVFYTKDQAEAARTDKKWATSQVQRARVQDEEWYPVKCDLVAKQSVLKDEHSSHPQLRDELGEEFERQNSTTEAKCTVMRARWLSKAQSTEMVGSLVLWMKDEAAAKHLLREGTALFGATGCFVSAWEKRDMGSLCFNCHQQGHRQASCSVPAKCGYCSGPHRTDTCDNQQHLKCPVCNRVGHSAMSWECRSHPQHWKYKRSHSVAKVARRGSSSGNSQPPSSPEVEMEDSPTRS